MRISRLRRAVATLACATAVVAGATACSPAEPEKTPTPTKTAIFASEDEALQAAVDVFQQFNAALDAVNQSREKSSSVLEPFVSEDFYSRLSEDLADDDGEYTVGSSAFRDESLLTLEQSDADAIVDIGICRDLTNVKVYDANGSEVTDERKLDVVPLKVMFVWSSTHNQLVIDGLDAWQDSEFC